MSQLNDFNPYPRGVRPPQDAVLAIIVTAGQRTETTITRPLAEVDALQVIADICAQRPQRAVPINADDRVVKISDREVLILGFGLFSGDRVTRVVIGTPCG